MHDRHGMQEVLHDHNIAPLLVYEYLTRRVSHIVNEVKSIGQAGWGFRNATEVVPALVWADGRSEQSQSTDLTLVGKQDGEMWWPCIVVLQTQYSGFGFEQVPFYCPALAWQRSRPWFVHPITGEAI